PRGRRGARHVRRDPGLAPDGDTVVSAEPPAATSGSVQYRVVVAKKDERVDGPDDADVVVTVPLDVAAAGEFDATVEFMRGRLKASGHTGVLLDVLASGDATRAVARLASSVVE